MKSKISFVRKFVISILQNAIVQIFLLVLLTSGMIYFLQSQIIMLFKFIVGSTIPVWILVLCIAVIVIFIYVILVVVSKRKSKKGAHIVTFRIRNGREEEIPFQLYKVDWLAYIPNQTFRIDEYVWLTGPFCPRCSMELKWGEKKKILGRKEYYWRCPGCEVRYPRPEKSKHQTEGEVEDICYAKIFRKMKFEKKRW